MLVLSICGRVGTCIRQIKSPDPTQRRARRLISIRNLKPRVLPIGRHRLALLDTVAIM